jgi:hypothetical protein
MTNSFKSPAILLIGLLGIGASAIAGVLHVAAYGSDSSTCGRQSPCRSISQAMENAASGDTIYVGPGLYGDVNADNFTGPGDWRMMPPRAPTCGLHLNKFEMLYGAPLFGSSRARPHIG